MSGGAHVPEALLASFSLVTLFPILSLCCFSNTLTICSIRMVNTQADCSSCTPIPIQVLTFLVLHVVDPFRKGLYQRWQYPMVDSLEPSPRLIPRGF